MNRKILETKCPSFENWLNYNKSILCNTMQNRVNVYMLTGEDFLIGLGLKKQRITAHIVYMHKIYYLFLKNNKL